MELLLVFFRSLVSGRVKTRLAEAIGDAHALGVYAAMLFDLADRLTAANILPVGESRPARRTSASGASARDEKTRRYLAFADAGGPMGPFIGARMQEGDTLFERMANAMECGLEIGAGKVLLIGTDIPGLTIAHIDELFWKLDSHGAVIGPSIDGGYYAIGFTSTGFRREAFRPAPGSMVADETARILAECGVSTAFGASLADVDTIDDLKQILARKRRAEYPRLFAYCREAGL